MGTFFVDTDHNQAVCNNQFVKLKDFIKEIHKVISA